MGIFSFYDFVNEKLGVSEASLIFVSILESRSMGIFREFINSEDKSLKITEDINYLILRPYIKNVQLYSKFPVTKFELDISYRKLNQKEWDKKYPSHTKKIATGGVASFFGNKNWSGYSKIVEPIKQITEHSIIVNLGISIDVSPSFNIGRKDHVNELLDDISSTFYHELNHCYEHYLRVIKYTDIMRPENRSFNSSLSFTGDNIWKFPKKIWKFWNKFNYYLYVSEYHEIRANVQEIYYFITEHPDKDLKDFQIYRTADDMENFNHQTFYDGLIETISEHEPYKGSEKIVAERIKEMWIRTYEKECKLNNVNPLISFSTLRKMDCLEFFKYWQKRINFAGQRIKRKAHSIKADL